MIVFQRPLVRLAMLIIFPFQHRGEEYIRILTQTDYEDGDTVMVLRDPNGRNVTLV